MRIVFSIILFFCIEVLFAQNLGNSPYTQYGIGDLTEQGSGRLSSMGNIGAANYTATYLNFVNPALMPMNKLTIFDAGFSGQRKQLMTSKGSDVTTGAHYSHVSFGFPVIATKWYSALQFKPYSSTNYEFNSTSKVAGDTSVNVNLTNQGSGNLSTVSWSHAVKFNTIRLGLTTSYLFGGKTQEENQNFQNTNLITKKLIRTNYSNIVFKPGIAFRKEIKYCNQPVLKKIKIKTIDSTGLVKWIEKDTLINSKNYSCNDSSKVSSGVFWNIGFSMDYFLSLNPNEFVSTSTLNRTNNIPLQTDTLNDYTKIITELPPLFRFGIGLDKTMKWSVGLDFAYQKWSNAKWLNNIQDFKMIGLGFEKYVVMFGMGENRAILLRGGANYQVTPYFIRGMSINDLSARIGMGFQLPKIKADGIHYPKILNLGLAFGQRGTTSNQLIQERYIRIDFSVNITDRWFDRPKYD